ncbi:MAG TPA: carboxypeptidase-like regulatory domain-containing protein [Pyrinomonadaceae bacterium]|nr:carboxypeptidase-like regulatory domain-containing protein [Pyrinomonadaceae bacterium]
MPLVPHTRRLPLFILALASLFICLHSASAQTATPTPTPLVTQFTMSGDEGEYISGGQDYVYKPSNATLSVRLLADNTGDGIIDTISFSAVQGNFDHWWTVDLSTAGLGKNLAPGSYVKKPSFAANNTNLDVSGDHRGCGTVGSFTIHEINIDYSGASPRLVNFAASFEQRCYETTATLLGAFYYRYTGSQSVASISGRLADSAGNPVANAKVAINGSKIATTTTDLDGNYTFPKLLSGGNYRVVPTPSATYVYSPARRKILRLNGDHEADFAAVPLYKITGRVTDENGAPVANLPVALQGAKTENGGTDSKGYYKFTGLRADGNFTVTPISQHFRFTPSNRTFYGLPGNQTLNFKGAPKEYVIGGQILDDEGQPMVGLIVNLGGDDRKGAVKTDGNGRYQFRNLKDGSLYFITPEKPYFRFFPGTRAFPSLSGSWDSIDFMGIRDIHILSGVVLDSNANALPGVTVTLSGSQSEIAITDQFGRYRFTGVPAGGNYTLTPSLEGRTFSPASRSFNLLNENITIANFLSSP